MDHIAVRLTPGASSDRIDGWDEDADGRAVLRVRVRARPVDGKANDALVKLIAKALGVPKSAVAIQHGCQSRTKILEIAGLSVGEANRRLTGL